MLLTVGFEPNVGSVQSAGVSSLRSPGGLDPTEGTPPLTGTETSALSWRQSTPSWSATKSRLPKRKVWDGLKTEGTHIPIGGSVGNSSEPKRVVSLEPIMTKMAERWAIR